MSTTKEPELEAVRSYWNRLALNAPEGCQDHWVDNDGQPLSDLLFVEVAEYVIRQLPKPGRTQSVILEIGCGTGRILKALQTKLPTSKLWGLDFAEEQIAHARLRVPSANLESQDLAEFLRAKGRSMVGRLDLVFLHSVTQYFPSEEYLMDLLGMATALLRPNGVLLLIDVPIDWYHEEMRGVPKRGALAPLKEAIKRLTGYKPREKPAPKTAFEVLGGRVLEVPTFTGFWVNPEAIQAFAQLHFSSFRIEYQLFKTKPINYRKWRPTFILKHKL